MMGCRDASIVHHDSIAQLMARLCKNESYLARFRQEEFRLSMIRRPKREKIAVYTHRVYAPPFVVYKRREGSLASGQV